MELSKVRTAEEIIARFKDGQIIAIGGQTNQYMPDRLIDCVLESGARHLTIYSIDSSDPGHGVSLLVEAGRVDAMITTHVGTNPLTNAKIQSGALKAEFNPMGTFIERIRCGGAGLGGVLTKTGLGTVVEEGNRSLRSMARAICWRPPSAPTSPSPAAAGPTLWATWPTAAAAATPPTR